MMDDDWAAKAFAPIPEKKQRQVSPNVTAVTPIEFDYLIVACHYTLRLVRHYLDLGAEFTLTCKHGAETHITSEWADKQGKDSVYNIKYQSRPDYDEFEYPPMPMAIRDDENVYVLCSDETDGKTLAEEAQVVRDCDVAERDTISFRCENLFQAFDVIDKLTQLQHCAGFGVTPYEMALVTHKNGKRALIMYFDTESG